MLAAAVIMRWLLALCHRKGLYDIATTIGHHHRNVPRIGGAVFLPAFLIGLLSTLLIREYKGDIADTLQLSTFVIGCGTMGVYLLGILDDLVSLSAGFKWGLKLAVCAVFPFCTLIINNLYGFLGCHELSYAVSIGLTFGITLLIVESINAIDDTDGLAATMALLFLGVISFKFYSLGYYTYAYLGSALSGALLVFLRYNMWGDDRIGTKVFMGNCGSLTLGFTIAYLAIKYAMDNKQVMTSRPDALLTTYSLLLLPLFDYIVVTVQSLWLGADNTLRRQLRFQYLLRSCHLSERKTTCIIVLWAVWFYAFNKGLAYFGISLTTVVGIDILIYAFVRLIVANLAHRNYQIPEEDVIVADDTDDYRGEDGMVSVIMPTWNSERFVGESIESIMAQTYPHIELIITDDASTDSTPDILRSYAERYDNIRIILNTKNGGAGRSRNCSIQAARGRYIAFCDSDDRWDPKKIERQVSFMQEKDVALCFCPYYTCGERNEFLGYVSAPRRVSLFQMMCDNKIGFLTAIYDTQVLGKQLMPSQRKRQDHALLLSLLRKCRYAYSVGEPLAHYRLHGGNMSAGKMGLLRYNAKTYNSVFGWRMIYCWAFLFVFFMPAYFWKRIRNLLINISRTQLG